MDYEKFEELCDLLSSALDSDQDSLRLDIITVREKLSVNLQYIVSRDSYESLQLLFYISS